MDTSLDHLQPQFRVKVFELLARAVEQRIPVIVTCTLRTAAEQADAVKRGVSWRSHSLHEDGLAVDIVPVFTYLLHGGAVKLEWSPVDPAWQTLGVIGERLGLVWGGRWLTHPDLSHFQLGT